LSCVKRDNIPTVVQAEQSAYETIFELTSGTNIMKSVRDTLIQLLQFVGGFEHPTNFYFATQMIEHIENSTTEYSLDDVLSKVFDHYNCTKQIGPVKRVTSTAKQSYGKDCKKKGDNSVMASPAIRVQGCSVTCLHVK
jgi:hypothetical protein